MDNTAILFNAIMRTYRNSIVQFIRERLSVAFGENAANEVRSAFKTDEWESLRLNAIKSRSEESGKIVQAINDEFELLGVEKFSNVFEKHFVVLFPRYRDVPKKERNSARDNLCRWVRHIKSVRDPVSHPITNDIGYDDALEALSKARQILDFCELSSPAHAILNAQATLLGGISSNDEKAVAALPPQDEVVVDFVGRHLELEKLQEWLGNRNLRRYGLSGEGGKGKSAIAYAFARSVASQSGHGFDAVIWLSAKLRRFIEGQTIRVNRPDFCNRKTAVERILYVYGEEIGDDESDNEARAINCLNEFPALIVADDIDSVAGAGEDAIEFLLMTVAERTQSRVLFTSRRAMTGFAACTWQVAGLNSDDGKAFIRTRCSLMGISPDQARGHEQSILSVTDSSPLYIEDLLRLSQAGLDIQQAIGLWKDKRGDDAREYAMRREFEMLSDDARRALLALALAGPSDASDLSVGLGWPMSQVSDALLELRKMFLMPRRDDPKIGKLSLNRNIQLLVLKVFDGSDAIRRTQRLMDAASGKLVTRRGEDEKVGSGLRKFAMNCRQFKFDEAETGIAKLIAQLPGRHELYSAIGYAQMKQGKDADARENFRRSHELKTFKTDTYWHWSDLEAKREEWQESARVADLGLGRFPGDSGLLFRKGYAKHRSAREAILSGLGEPAHQENCEAIAILESALDKCVAEDAPRKMISVVLRALILSAECEDDLKRLVTYFFRADALCPGDFTLATERERLGRRYAMLAEK